MSIQRIIVAAALLVVWAALSHTGAVAAQDFVTRSGTGFVLNGRPFRFSGTNNYYLGYETNYMVNDLITTAARNGLQVLRVWGFVDVGDPDGSNSIDGSKRNVQFQHWDGRQPTVNGGPTGLEKLDFLIARSSKLDLKLVIVLTNNWPEFGGMDQYVRWKGGTYHDDFFRDWTIKRWYKAYAANLINRVNVFSGVAYKNDPAILAWEMANEPRCHGNGPFPASPDCSVALITDWASEMSTYIKRNDQNHLVGLGDEGFYCIPGVFDTTENCAAGVDTLALGSLPTLDYVSFHLYPDQWRKTPEWGAQWIARHINDAHAAGKPAVLGEFGVTDRVARGRIYEAWTDLMRHKEAAGDLLWMLAGRENSGGLYPDYDGYAAYCPSDVCRILGRHALLTSGRDTYNGVLWPFRRASIPGHH